MKTSLKIPAGWRRLHVKEIVRRGDKHDTPGLGHLGWRRTLCPGRKLTYTTLRYIRKIKTKSHAHSKRTRNPR